MCRYEVLEEVQEKVDRVLWDYSSIEEDSDPEYDEDESILRVDEDEDDWSPEDDWPEDEDEDDESEEDDPYRHLRDLIS